MGPPAVGGIETTAQAAAGSGNRSRFVQTYSANPEASLKPLHLFMFPPGMWQSQIVFVQQLFKMCSHT